MGHILCKGMRQHIILISLVAKMLNPLHLIAAIVDEAFIEERQVLPSLHHHIGLERLLSETRHRSV